MQFYNKIFIEYLCYNANLIIYSIYIHLTQKSFYVLNLYI